MFRYRKAVIDVLSGLFILRGVPGHVRSDNGPELIAKVACRIGSWPSGRVSVVRGFCDTWLRELTEALAHQGCHIGRLLPDEANDAV